MHTAAIQRRGFDQWCCRGHTFGPNATGEGNNLSRHLKCLTCRTPLQDLVVACGFGEVVFNGGGDSLLQLKSGQAPAPFILCAGQKSI
jgi:hypothetical protein